MAIETQPGQQIRVKISKTISRATARKTIERLFLQDKSVSAPLEKRSRNFKEQPKRRGGTIWTKRPNKIHPALAKGDQATFRASAQSIRDLNSVESFVEVTPA